MMPVFIISFLGSEKKRNSCIEHCHSINLDPIQFKAVNDYEILENIKREKDERFLSQEKEFTLRNLEHSHDASQTFGHQKSHTLGQPAKGPS